jgi:predicted transcriptional regulator YdeE
MKPTIVNRESITVLGVQDRLTDMDQGVPEMWEVRFMAHHDHIAALSTDKVYYGCAFSTDQAGTCDYLAGMAVPASTAASEGLTLREIPGGPYAMVECTVNAMDDAFDLIEGRWMPSSGHEKDDSRPTLDCYPPGTVSNDSPMYIYVPIVERQE